jgi:hypothetical protein
VENGSSTLHLAVFDFDGTLFRSPEPPSWWSKGYWWGSDLSLNPPCVPQLPDESWWIDATVLAAHDAIADPTTLTLCMTGRSKYQANFVDRVPELLAQQRLEFDAIRLSPTERSKRWRLDQIKEWKLDQIFRVLEAVPAIETVEIWDDKEENLDFFSINIADAGYYVADYLVDEIVKKCE